MMRLAASVAILTSVSLGLGVARGEQASRLELSFANLKSAKGKLCISLWRGSQGYPDDGAKAYHASCHALGSLKKADDGEIRLVLDGIPEDDFALAAYHDENEDNEFNTGIFGIPKEGFGFSRNPTVRFGAPSYDAVKFHLGGDRATQSVVMKYF